MTRLRLERSAQVGRVILASPDRQNVIDRQCADELFAAFQQFEADGHVKVVHLSGDGDDFCGGADLEAMERMLDAPSDTHRQDAEALGRVYLAIRALMKPVVCSVRGRALGAGAGLALAADVVLAHADAQFGFPEVRFGFVPAMVLAMLRRTAGEKRAADLVLSGRIVDAEEAAAIGLASRALPAVTFDEDVEAMLAGLARSSPTSLALTKWLLYKLDSLSFEDGIAAGVVTNVEARGTEDFRAGLRRFLGH